MSVCGAPFEGLDRLTSSSVSNRRRLTEGPPLDIEVSRWIGKEIGPVQCGVEQSGGMFIELPDEW